MYSKHFQNCFVLYIFGLRFFLYITFCVLNFTTYHVGVCVFYYCFNQIYIIMLDSMLDVILLTIHMHYIFSICTIFSPCKILLHWSKSFIRRDRHIFSSMAETSFYTLITFLRLHIRNYFMKLMYFFLLINNFTKVSNDRKITMYYNDS